jgi:c-di-GMP-binding flagellar brake protein YcgR
MVLKEHPQHMRMQGRQYPRMQVPAPFVCSLRRHGLAKLFARRSAGLGVVFDVSLKGAKVMSETAVKAGDRLSLTLRLPKQMFPVSIESATVRWAKDQTFGVEFMALSPIAQMRLRKFMTLTPSSSP